MAAVAFAIRVLMCMHMGRGLGGCGLQRQWVGGAGAALKGASCNSCGWEDLPYLKEGCNDAAKVWFCCTQYSLCKYTKASA